MEAERDDRRDDVRRESREFGHESSHEARAVLLFIGRPGAGRRDLFNVSAVSLCATANTPILNLLYPWERRAAAEERGEHTLILDLKTVVQRSSTSLGF